MRTKINKVMHKICSLDLFSKRMLLSVIFVLMSCNLSIAHTDSIHISQKGFKSITQLGVRAPLGAFKMDQLLGFQFTKRYALGFLFGIEAGEPNSIVFRLDNIVYHTYKKFSFYMKYGFGTRLLFSSVVADRVKGNSYDYSTGNIDLHIALGFEKFRIRKRHTGGVHVEFAYDFNPSYPFKTGVQYFHCGSFVVGYSVLKNRKK